MSSLDQRVLPTIPSLPHYLYNEKEARIMGAAANRLVNLRAYRDFGTGGSLTVKDSKGLGTSSLTLSDNDMFAVLSLLVQRETIILSSFNIECEEDNAQQRLLEGN